MAFNVSLAGLPLENGALFGGLPTSVAIDACEAFTYVGTLDLVLVEGIRDTANNVVQVANEISVPALSWADSNEYLLSRMMGWDPEGRQWTYSEPNSPADPRYDALKWPRMPLRISEIVRQLNQHYRKPGDEPAHRAGGFLTDAPFAEANLTFTVNPTATVFNFTTTVEGHFLPGQYAYLGNEVVWVETVGGTQLSCRRGQLGTFATGYTAGTTVTYDRYCNPYHSYVVAYAETIDADTKSRLVYTPGATPLNSDQNWLPIIEDQGGDWESRGFVVFLRLNANPGTGPGRDNGDVVLHLNVLTALWAA